MKKINILVACGSGIATSTLAAEEVKRICDEIGLNYSITQSSMIELNHRLKGQDLLLTTNQFKGDLGIKQLCIAPFITGIGQDQLIIELKAALLSIIEKD